MDTFLALSSTEIAAWWGAVIATAVLIWDVFKWKTSGPKLRLRVVGNMQTFNVPGSEGKTFIKVNVDNIGTGETTITNLGFVYYKNWISSILKKSSKCMVVPYPTIGDINPPPHILKPGGQWVGMADQDEDLEKMAQEGYLICQISHSFNETPVCKRVLIEKEE